MSADRLLEVIRALEEAGIRVWLDGGWGIDALVGEQTRPHGDLDLVVDNAQFDKIFGTLQGLGFEVAVDELPTDCELMDEAGHEVHLHFVTFQSDGRGVPPPSPDGSPFVFSAEGFHGRGTVAGREVACISGEVQLEYHLRSEPDADDLHDMRLLRDRLGLELPPPY